MADVWLARGRGPAGFTKVVVLKTIRAGFASEGRFMRLFFAEARLAALLNHPNCVQIFDFGEEGGTYFIAMEFKIGRAHV